MNIIVHANGFVQVDEFYVQDMQKTANPTSIVRDPANAARPSCTCRDGHSTTWCSHKKAAFDHLIAAKK